ncbi:MAG: alpha/beta hydrolase [Alphaproteobacteria bacterium]|nr:alpha/beta hydrolase [Alphaproteobacteria bacterium]
MRAVAYVFLLLSLAIGGACVASSLPSPDGSPGAYRVPNTQVREIKSTTNGAIYRLFFATPPDYATSGKRYPVVYMLDADYSFALTRNVVQHFVERSKLPEMILVAIGYPGASDDMEVYYSNRKRDYTPGAQVAVGYSSGDTGGHNGQGGADLFRSFVADEVIPFVAAKYPVSNDRTFIGHSYGGLFGTYVLLTRPDLFGRYVIISPSLWFDNGLIMKLETQSASRPAMRARAFFAIGALETQTTTGAPMVQQLTHFAKKLKDRRSAGLEVTLDVFPGETHESIFPGAVTRGLLTVFRPAPPSS